jgi:hypothetical protein
MAIEKSRSSSAYDDPTRFGGTADDVPQDKPKHKYDKPQFKKLWTKLKDWYEQENDRQATNRYQMALDEDYYDAMQWTEEDAAELLNRGQAPLVFNEVKPTLDWMIGTERRTRIDYKVMPRNKEGYDDAENKTKLLKYLSDVNKTPFHRSRAFADAVKAGLGWLETGVRGDDSDELLFTRNENWRTMLYDSNSIEPDLSDARYIFRWKWLDEDIAMAYFPDRKEIIRQSVQDANQFGPSDSDEDDVWYMGARATQAGTDYASSALGKYHQYDGSPFAATRRSRVKMIECWYRIPTLTQYFADGHLYKTQYDPSNPEHKEALTGGYSLYDRLTMEVRCAIFTAKGLVFDGKSPYKHNRLPFVPVWCYRRKRDNAPYGCIRNLRDPQDDLNKRASKALWILSSNRVIADKGAVDDWDELRDEIARPDSLIIKNPGKELQVDRDVQIANEHLQLMERDILHIRNVGGVNNENLGRQSNADSGVAIQARQDQGGVVTTEPFDNLRYAVQLLGEMELSNIEQFYTDEKDIRITGPRGTAKFVRMNEQAPDGSVLNDVTAFQADFVVAEEDYRSTLRQAMFESLFDITGRLAQMNPEIALNMLDLVVEMADLPNRDELVQRIRKLSGQRDPDEDIPEEQQMAMDQQEEQAKQQAAALQQKAVELELAQKEAAVMEAQARAEKLQADAQKVLSDMQNAGAGQAELQQAQQQAQEQIQKIQQQAQERVDNLINQVAQLQMESKNRSNEINQRHEAELAKANASKEATIEAEKIRAEAQKEVEAGKRETEKAIAEAQAKADKALEALTKQMDGVVDGLTKQIEQLGKKLEESKKEEKAEPKEQPQQPTVINVTVDAKQDQKPTTKKINIKKDAKGNIIGADVEESE